MSGWREALPEDERARLEKTGPAQWAPPMLATLTDARFSDPDWIFERKLDGERAVVVRHGRRLRLLSRNRKDLADTYPELAEALAAEACDDFAADGEIVAFEGALTSFSRLQRRMQIADPEAARASGVAVYYYLFDMMHLDGWSLEGLAVRRRKALLKRALSFADPLRYTPHRNRAGEAYFREACEKGWEGVIAKRAAAPYCHGRSRDWLKFKCAKGQELVIGGFTEPKGSRVGFGALLVGYYADGELRYAGKVGTGYNDAFLKEFRKRLEALRRKTSPFADDVTERGAGWVSPDLVGEFGFTEWTRDGKLRHPRFLGLRRDKAAEDVVREAPDG
jgi:bifunctional non-homologous end joining protein LigD